MLPPQEIIARLTLAPLLGACVGFNRSRVERAAGLRTNAMVALGSCLFTIVSAFGFADILGNPGIALDPSRVAAQVVTGIGFLGAGTIIVQHEVVKGLTTAASVWAVAALGLAVGGGLYLAAVYATVLMLVVLILFKRLEAFIYPMEQSSITSVVDRESLSLQSIRLSVADAGANVDRLAIEPQKSSNTEDRIRLWLRPVAAKDYMKVVESLRKIDGVSFVTAADFSNGTNASAPVTPPWRRWIDARILGIDE